MQVFTNKESIGALTKTGNTTVQLSSSTVTLGAKQYSSGNLVCDLSTSGVGGLDTGLIAADTLYYVYAVVSAGNSVLIASTNAQNPLGFNAQKKKVGAFKTSLISQVDDVASIYGILMVHATLSARIENAPVPVVTSESSSFIESTSRPVTGQYELNMPAGMFAVAPVAVTAAIASSDVNSMIVSITTTKIVLRTEVNGTGAAFNSNFTVAIQRQEADYKLKEEVDWTQY